jgi:hypothetical protein
MFTGVGDATVVIATSIATAFFNYDIGSGQNTVAKHFFA